MRRFAFFMFMTAMIVLTAAQPLSQARAAGTDTDITIRVKAGDSGFIGNNTGGAHIVIRRRDTGDIVFDGHTRGQGDAARLEFTLELIEPLPVTITATGPLIPPQSTVTASADYILIPGKDYSSHDGLIMTLPGLAVNLLNPVTSERIAFDPNVPVPIAVHMMSLSGHAGQDGTDGNLERYEVEAHIYKESAFITSVPMTYSNAAGQFMSSLQIPQSGTYKIHVTAYDPVTKDTGMDSTTFILYERDE